MGSVPGWGTKIPHATGPSQNKQTTTEKKKKKEKKTGGEGERRRTMSFIEVKPYVKKNSHYNTYH